MVRRGDRARHGVGGNPDVDGSTRRGGYGQKLGGGYESDPSRRVGTEAYSCARRVVGALDGHHGACGRGVGRHAGHRWNRNRDVGEVVAGTSRARHTSRSHGDIDRARTSRRSRRQQAGGHVLDVAQPGWRRNRPLHRAVIRPCNIDRSTPKCRTRCGRYSRNGRRSVCERVVGQRQGACVAALRHGDTDRAATRRGKGRNLRRGDKGNACGGRAKVGNGALRKARSIYGDLCARRPCGGGDRYYARRRRAVGEPIEETVRRTRR